MSSFLDFYGSTVKDFIAHDRKPQAFKPGDEWHPGAQPALDGGAEVFSGIIWLWPDMGAGDTQVIDSNIIWYGFPSTGSACCKAKQRDRLLAFLQLKSAVNLLP